SSSSDYELFDVDEDDDDLMLIPEHAQCIMDDPMLVGKKDNHIDRQQKQKQILEKLRTMEEKVRMAIPERPAKPPTICVVPVDLTEGNRGAYSPKVVCIGPIFDSKRKTDSMLRLEHYKWRCVRKLIIERHPGGTLESDDWSLEVHTPLLRKCTSMMMRLVPQVRASYSSLSFYEDTNGDNTSNEELAIKMLLDGCFVLHRLLKYGREANGGMDDDDWNQRLGRCWVWATVKSDLLLLNNQVPFFVVRKLLKLLRSNIDESDDILVNGGLQFFSSLHPPRLHSAPIACHDVHHLLHLFYLSIDLPLSCSHQDSACKNAALPTGQTWWVPCAKELEEAGVRLCARKHGAASFLDVRFHQGNLEIPPLQLFDYSEPLFRNLIAFEQTYPATPGRITEYAIFMDCLVKTSEDLRLLHRSGVLVNYMNGERGDAAMQFFNRLCAGVHTSAGRNYLAGVLEEVSRYQRGKWPRWRAALVSNYFTNPWVTASVFAAAILLAMTVLQTFYTVVGYYKPSK
ncbi:hypothetical protein CFC21_049669, partial [Triticum aestivum]